MKNNEWETFKDFVTNAANSDTYGENARGLCLLLADQYAEDYGVDTKKLIEFVMDTFEKS